MEFLNKRVIVTGANRSMGRKMAVSFAEQGADVVISYRSDEAGANETVAEIKKTGRDGAAFYADFSEMAQVATFAEQALTHLGHVDVLINNAGMLCRETFFELTPEKMQQVFQVNTLAPLRLAQLCVDNMLKSNTTGCIINISSIAAKITMPKGIGYAASKAALNKWTKTAALNLASDGIRVNAIGPGVIHSGMNEKTAETNPELWEYYVKSIPMGNPGTPEDIAQMALFLASERANWITGKIFNVDGGHVL